MAPNVSEADWKVFRELREHALERLCERILSRLTRACEDRARSAHERYVEVHSLLEEYDRLVASAFDNPRRSMMHAHLLAIDELGLLESEDLARMTPETRAWIDSVRDIRSR